MAIAKSKNIPNLGQVSLDNEVKDACLFPTLSAHCERK
jgi:hypothetical protein